MLYFSQKGYDVDPGVRKYERVLDSFEGIIEEVGSLLKNHKNKVKVRHYSFIDLKNFGYDWNPDWFSLVRDPIDKVH